MTADFVCYFKIYNEKDREKPIYYKDDGEIYEEAQTIKLQIDTNYIFEIKFQPPQMIRNIQISGSQKFISKNNSESYQLTYSTTGHTATPKKKRDYIPIDCELHEHGALLLKLQVKFYKLKDAQHLSWGKALHHIEFHCTAKDSGTVIVQKTNFR